VGRVGQVLGPVGELAVRAAVLLLLCASSALAAPDAYELAGRGRDWLARQVRAGEVTKQGPGAQAHALLALLSGGYTHRAGPGDRYPARLEAVEQLLSAAKAAAR